MKHVWQTLMDLNISTKFIIFVYSPVLIIFTSLSVTLFSKTVLKSRTNIVKNGLDTIKVANLLIEKEQQYLYGIAEYYSTTPAVQEYLKHSNACYSMDSMDGDITQVVRARMYAVGLAFYNLRGCPVDYMTIDNSKYPVDQSAEGRPFHKLINNEKKFVWEFIDQDDNIYMLQDNSPKLCLWYLINDVKTLRPIGLVALSIDSRKLITAENIPASLYNTLIVLDQSNRDVFNNFHSFSPEAKRVMREMSVNLNGFFITDLDGDKYTVIYAKVSKSDLISYLVIPYTTYKWDVFTLSIEAISGIVLCTMLLLPLVVLVTRTLTNPLKKLTTSMISFSEGNLNASVSFKYNDEIGQLGRVFNKTVKEYKWLVEREYMLALKEKDAELSFLQSQMNPHFLNNVINGIQWLAIQRGDNEIADLAYSMGQIFHISLNNGKKLITIQQEKDLIQYYLRLQKRRFGGKVDYDIHFDDNTLNLRVPKLIIQPLVENSIYHGSEKSTTPVLVSVSCRLKNDGERLIIEVSDNGCGIPENVLKHLPNNPPPSECGTGSRYAMRNINERLKLTYDDDYHFTIESIFGKGTCIKIDLPVLTGDSE